jgi:hypothetical protein
MRRCRHVADGLRVQEVESIKDRCDYLMILTHDPNVVQVPETTAGAPVQSPGAVQFNRAERRSTFAEDQ